MDRFRFIHGNLRCFETGHFTACAANFKVWRLLDTFNADMSICWGPTECVSLDDSLIPVKGTTLNTKRQ